jgi:hypothetical protein
MKLHSMSRRWQIFPRPAYVVRLSAISAKIESLYTPPETIAENLWHNCRDAKIRPMLAATDV